VDVGGTKLLLVAVGPRLHREHRAPTGPEAGPAEVEREVRGFLARTGLRPRSLGIAVPGLLDAAGRVAACDVLPRLEGWRPADALVELGIPVRALNDAEAALAGETHGLRPDATAGIVMAGTAIGAAFRVGGSPLRGARGWAGELGYLPLSTGGEVRRLDELAGGAWIARRLRTDGAGLAERAARGDAAALSAIREAGAALGLGLAAGVNLLNPELLVLGGGAAELPGYREAALASAARHALPQLWAACEVRPPRHGEAAAALGAAYASAHPAR
jgi:predicted NBD/HSP70 family sugar kinase